MKAGWRADQPPTSMAMSWSSVGAGEAAIVQDVQPGHACSAPPPNSKAMPVAKRGIKLSGFERTRKKSDTGAVWTISGEAS